MLAATQPTVVQPPWARLSRFTGSADTLNKMREHVWGPRGEKSPVVRQFTEDVVRGVQGKDYLSEIVAIRNATMTCVHYINDPLHVEYIKDPERMVQEIRNDGQTLADCDEIAQLIGTMLLQVGRIAEFVVVGFGSPGDYTHVFAHGKEPKSGEWIVCDPVAGSDERSMIERVSTYEIWSLDEY